MIKSHSFIHKDFDTAWYQRWVKELKQDKDHLDGNSLHSNKFWQNAVMVQALYERGLLEAGRRGVGFGVGQERLPALFAKYDVDITATDQDFKTQKAGHWAAKELATGAQSLNHLGICDKKRFMQHVEYMPVDMTKLPLRLRDKYDFSWSNCALGHLGSIPAGLTFIEKSLECLKPGGWSVHTTELNILSNKATVEGGSTVIFRLKDIDSLLRRLVDNGYEAMPFTLQFGALPVDKRVSIRPEFGNDHSKIQVMGHLATQIVLIIRKPTKPLTGAKKAVLKASLRSQYAKNLLSLKKYQLNDPTIKPILKAQKLSPQGMMLKPVQRTIKAVIKRGKSATVFVEYRNGTQLPLFSTYARLGAHAPIALATDEPRDRASKFAAADWEGKNENRAAVSLWRKIRGNTYEELDYAAAGQDFAFKLTLSADSLPKGVYKECFSVVQEGKDWVPNTMVNIEITVS